MAYHRIDNHDIVVNKEKMAKICGTLMKSGKAIAPKKKKIINKKCRLVKLEKEVPQRIRNYPTEILLWK